MFGEIRTVEPTQVFLLKSDPYCHNGKNCEGDNVFFLFFFKLIHMYRPPYTTQSAQTVIPLSFFALSCLSAF